MITKNPLAANIVIFGGSGDLTWRKLIPALYNLYIDGQLPKQFAVFCVSRGDMNKTDFLKHLLEGINTFSRKGNAEKISWNKFSKNIYYLQGDIKDDKTYTQVKNELAVNDKRWKQRAIRMF